MMGAPGRKPPHAVIAALSPSAVALEAVGGCRNCSLPASSEAAAICAGMPRNWMTAALAKWGRNEQAMRGIKYALWVEAAGLASKECWKLEPGRPLLETMATMAAEEFSAPARPDGLPARIPEAEKAQRMGMTRSRWYRTWRDRYQMVAALPEQWLAEAGSYIMRRQAA